MQKNVSTVKQQLIRYVFSEVIECLQKLNTRMNAKHSKKIDFKNQATSKQINRVKDIQIRVCEYKAVKCSEM